MGAPVTMALYCMVLDPGSILVTTRWEWAEFGFWIVVGFFPLGFAEGIALGAGVTFLRQAGRQRTQDVAPGCSGVWQRQ